MASKPKPSGTKKKKLTPREYRDRLLQNAKDDLGREGVARLWSETLKRNGIPEDVAAEWPAIDVFSRNSLQLKELRGPNSPVSSTVMMLDRLARMQRRPSDREVFLEFASASQLSEEKRKKARKLRRPVLEQLLSDHSSGLAERERGAVGFIFNDASRAARSGIDGEEILAIADQRCRLTGKPRELLLATTDLPSDKPSRGQLWRQLVSMAVHEVEKMSWRIKNQHIALVREGRPIGSVNGFGHNPILQTVAVSIYDYDFDGDLGATREMTVGARVVPAEFCVIEHLRARAEAADDAGHPLENISQILKLTREAPCCAPRCLRHQDDNEGEALPDCYMCGGGGLVRAQTRAGKELIDAYGTIQKMMLSPRMCGRQMVDGIETRIRNIEPIWQTPCECCEQEAGCDCGDHERVRDFTCTKCFDIRSSIEYSCPDCDSHAPQDDCRHCQGEGYYFPRVREDAELASRVRDIFAVKQQRSPRYPYLASGGTAGCVHCEGNMGGQQRPGTHADGSKRRGYGCRNKGCGASSMAMEVLDDALLGVVGWIISTEKVSRKEVSSRHKAKEAELRKKKGKKESDHRALLKKARAATNRSIKRNYEEEILEIEQELDAIELELERLRSEKPRGFDRDESVPLSVQYAREIEANNINWLRIVNRTYVEKIWVTGYRRTESGTNTLRERLHFKFAEGVTVPQEAIDAILDRVEEAHRESTLKHLEKRRVPQATREVILTLYRSGLTLEEIQGRLGRFGMKASTTTIREVVARAEAAGEQPVERNGKQRFVLRQAKDPELRALVYEMRCEGGMGFGKIAEQLVALGYPRLKTGQIDSLVRNEKLLRGKLDAEVASGRPARIKALRQQKKSWEQVAKALNKEGTASVHGLTWSTSSVQYYAQRLAAFGLLEQSVLATCGDPEAETRRLAHRQRVVDMRDIEGLTFPEIVARLTEQGARNAKNEPYTVAAVWQTYTMAKRQGMQPTPPSS